MTKTEETTRDLTAAIVLLYKNGLLGFQPRSGGAKADLRVIVCPIGDRGSIANGLWLTCAIPGKFPGDFDHRDLEIPIDAATYTLFMACVPGLSHPQRALALAAAPKVTPSVGSRAGLRWKQFCMWLLSSFKRP